MSIGTGRFLSLSANDSLSFIARRDSEAVSFVLEHVRSTRILVYNELKRMMADESHTRPTDRPTRESCWIRKQLSDSVSRTSQ